jgi:hypothetical protein
VEYNDGERGKEMLTTGTSPSGVANLHRRGREPHGRAPWVLQRCWSEDLLLLTVTG